MVRNTLKETAGGCATKEPGKGQLGRALWHLKDKMGPAMSSGQSILDSRNSMSKGFRLESASRVRLGWAGRGPGRKRRGVGMVNYGEGWRCRDCNQVEGRER